MAEYLQSKIFPVQTNRHYWSWLSQQPLVPNFFPSAYIPNNSQLFISYMEKKTLQNQQFNPSTKKKYSSDNTSYELITHDIPLWTEPNKNGFVPSLENRQSSIFSSCKIIKREVEHQNPNYKVMPNTELKHKKNIQSFVPRL